MAVKIDEIKAFFRPPKKHRKIWVEIPDLESKFVHLREQTYLQTQKVKINQGLGPKSKIMKKV